MQKQYNFIQFDCKDSTNCWNYNKNIELFVIILQNVKVFGNFAKIAQEFYLFFSQYFTPPEGKMLFFRYIFNELKRTGDRISLLINLFFYIVN